jgi:hypothetical protein
MNEIEKATKYFWSLMYDITRDQKGNLVQRSNKTKAKDLNIIRKSFSPTLGGLKSMNMCYLHSNIYIPKYKDEPNILPFYDEFPLYIPVGFEKGLLYGFNIHYLPPQNRTIFLDNYIKHLKNKVRAKYMMRSNDPVNLDEVNKQFIEKIGNAYMSQFLSSFSNSVLKVAFRSYLPNHIATRIYQLSFEEMESFKYLNLVFKPVFKRATAKQIYSMVNAQYQKYADADWSLPSV